MSTQKNNEFLCKKWKREASHIDGGLDAIFTEQSLMRERHCGIYNCTYLGKINTNAF